MIWKYTLFFVTFFTVALADNTVQPSPECGENEVFMSCGTACPKTCNSTGDEICTMQCVQGCFCKPDYVKYQGKCILPKQCPKDSALGKRSRKCGKRAEYKTCGSSCPETCYTKKDRVCTLQCVEGCFCKPRYVLHKGKCIKRKKCPKDSQSHSIKCGKNEEFTDCGSLCPETCTPNPDKFCPALCIAGCFCKRGYVRNNGKCILPQNCPKKKNSSDRSKSGSVEYTKVTSSSTSDTTSTTETTILYTDPSPTDTEPTETTPTESTTPETTTTEE